jgi:hypothetical protein
MKFHFNRIYHEEKMVKGLQILLTLCLLQTTVLATEELPNDARSVSLKHMESLTRVTKELYDNVTFYKGGSVARALVSTVVINAHPYNETIRSQFIGILSDQYTFRRDQDEAWNQWYISIMGKILSVLFDNETRTSTWRDVPQAAPVGFDHWSHNRAYD